MTGFYRKVAGFLIGSEIGVAAFLGFLVLYPAEAMGGPSSLPWPDAFERQNIEGMEPGASWRETSLLS